MDDAPIPEAPRDIITYFIYRVADTMSDGTPSNEADELESSLKTHEGDEEVVVKHPGDISEHYSRTFQKEKTEATSLWHLLTHIPKNSHCPTCQRCKLMNRHHRRGKGASFNAKAFGDQGTIDCFFAWDKQ